MTQYRGLNDVFWIYNWDGYAHVAGANGNTIRFPLVREWVPGNNFGAVYGTLWSNAYYNGLKVLPVVLQGSFPTTDGARTDFANFVVAVCNYFDAGPYYNIIDAVEVWNEPNAAGIDPNQFVSLCQSVATTVNGTSFSTPKKVVSGGIAGGLAGWDSYFSTVASGSNAYCRYDLGLHPYYSFACNARPAGATAYKNVVVANAIQKYDWAKNNMLYWANSSSVTNDIWVTEVAATSQEPWGQSGQDQALQQVAQDLKNRAYCRSMIVHREYHDDTLPGERPPPYGCVNYGEILYKSCLYQHDNNTPKAAYWGLQSRWSSWT